MKTECRKRNAAKDKINSRMDITFPHRRRFINEKRPVVEITEEYPALLTSEEVRHDGKKYFTILLVFC